MKIAEKISFLRKRKRLSQEQLAMKLDVSRQAVYKWEADISVPEIDKIKKLALVFGVSYDFLLNDSLDVSSLEDTAPAEAQVVGEATISTENIEEEAQNEAEPVIYNTEVEQAPSTEQVPPPFVQPSPVQPIKSNKKRRIALIVSLCVLGGIIFLSLFSIAMIRLFDELNIFAGIDTSTNSSNSDTYEISFVMPNGEVLSTQNVTSGASVSAPVPSSINGYNFKGWYINGAKWDESMTNFSDDTSIMAVYEPITYRIAYNLNGGTFTNTYIYEYTIEDRVTLPTPSKSGYAFVGWYKESTFETIVTGINPGSFGNIELYACFLEHSNKINYVLYGGINSPKNPSAFRIGEGITLEAPTHRDGSAVFAGWYTDDKFTKPISKITTAGDITIYAKWEHKRFDISYDGNSCTILAYKGMGSTGTSAVSTTVPGSFAGMPVKFISAYAFEGASIETLLISDGILSLDKNVFSGATIKEIQVPKSVLVIDPTAFIDCYGLERIEIASSNASYSDIDGVAFNKAGTRLLKYPQGKADTSYALPDTTNYVEAYAFYGCTNLTEVEFPNRVGGIDNCAFKNCTSLRKIYLGDILNYIGKEAFRNCSRLTEIELPSKLYSIGNYAFDGCLKLQSVKITKGVDVLGYSVFSNCVALENVDLGESCNEISSRVFENCTSLKSITLPDTVSKIGTEAFIGCTLLGSVIINQNAIWSITLEKTSSKLTLSTEEIASPATIARYFVSTYIDAVWKNEGEAVLTDKVTITYNAGIGTTSGKQSVEINKGTIYPYHPTPTCDDESKLFNGWFLDQAFNNPAEKYTIYTKDTTLYAKYLTITPCLDGTYDHAWGAWTTTLEGSCTSIELLSRTCTECSAKISSYGNRNISKHTGLNEPYVEDFKTKIKCYSCDAIMESKEFENVTLATLKEISLNGDVYGPQNLEYMTNGVWDEESTHCIAPKGTGDVTVEITLDGAHTIDYIYVKGNGSASFTVFVKYENETDYTLLGDGSFLSSEENASADRQIPFVDVADSGTKRIEFVSIIILGGSSDCLEEIGLFYIERA